MDRVRSLVDSSFTVVTVDGNNNDDTNNNVPQTLHGDTTSPPINNEFVNVGGEGDSANVSSDPPADNSGPVTLNREFSPIIQRGHGSPMVTTVPPPDEGRTNTATIGCALTQHSISSNSDAAQRTEGGRRLANSGIQPNTNVDLYLGIGNGNSANQSPFIHHQQSSLYLDGDGMDNRSTGVPWPLGETSSGVINNNYATRNVTITRGGGRPLSVRGVLGDSGTSLMFDEMSSSSSRNPLFHRFKNDNEVVQEENDHQLALTCQDNEYDAAAKHEQYFADPVVHTDTLILLLFIVTLKLFKAT